MTKRPEEIALMAQSGKLLADVFGYLNRLALVDMSTMQINDLVERYIINELRPAPPAKGSMVIAMR
jgi:methionyl aminopeptidase